MTLSAPPNVPGSRRVLPRAPSEHQAERVRALLHQDEGWVLRGDWSRYLNQEGETTLVPISRLMRDQRIAAAAWISQQQHHLYETLEGERRAPDGWVDSLPLYRALTRDEA